VGLERRGGEGAGHIERRRENGGGSGVIAGNHPEISQRGRQWRDRYRNEDFFTRSWFDRHPGAWSNGSPWAPFAWSAYPAWFGLASVDPVYYDYGANIYYADDKVYIDDQPVGSAEEYYSALRAQAAQREVASRRGDQWQSLGVFAVLGSDRDADKAQRFFQLAVDKRGTLGGNYFEKSSDVVQPIRGSVDRQGHRAAWTVGDDLQTIYETGVYNLSREEAPMLVHFDAAQNEVWTLVRLQQPRLQPQLQSTQTGNP